MNVFEYANTILDAEHDNAIFVHGGRSVNIIDVVYFFERCSNAPSLTFICCRTIEDGCTIGHLYMDNTDVRIREIIEKLNKNLSVVKVLIA